MNRIIVTGGAGFVGSAVARHIINDTQDAVCVVDKLTYKENRFLQTMYNQSAHQNIVSISNILST